MKKYLIGFLIASFTTINLYPQSNNLLPNKINSSSSIFIEYALFEVEFYKNGEGELKNKNVNSTIFGLSQNFKLSKSLDFIASFGISEGFEYNFLSTNLGIKLSENFSLSLGGGAYQINDDKWAPVGLDGNEPSSAEFGMNFGVNLMLNDNLGILMKYNLIEPKEDDSVGSMSLNGLSFGVVLK
tara:strand:- start:495 stop:1046 length:552 start_codon:yes stop_codon:yes gene_type:complete